MFSFGISILFVFHLSGCAGDIYVIWLFKRKYTDDTVLMNDTGPTMSIFVYDENTTEEEERLAKEHFEKVTRKESSEEKKSKNQKRAIGTSIALICIASIGFVLTLLCFYWDSYDIKFKVYEPYIFEYSKFWFALVCVGIIVFCAFTMKKYHTLKDIVAATLLVLGLPIFLCFSIYDGGYNISYTNDVKNYGIYNRYDESWSPELFPEEITEDMTPIYYSYYHDMVWDGVLEIYLEVRMTDDAYSELKAQYDGQLKECWYDTDYEEYAKADKFFVYKDERYCDRPDIRKIIFNDKENIVIFEYMYGIDPMYFENIYYFERFNIDAKEYSIYLEAQNESN